MKFKIREVFLKVVPVCKDTLKTESKKEKQRLGRWGWSGTGNRRGRMRSTEITGKFLQDEGGKKCAHNPNRVVLFFYPMKTLHQIQ